MLKAKWLPNEPPSLESFAMALAIDDEYWERQEQATRNAIVKAWKGS